MNNKRKLIVALLLTALIFEVSMPETSFAKKSKQNNASLSSKSVTIRVGSSKKIKLKNNKKKVKWVVTKGKKIIKLSNQSKKGVTVKAKKKGNAKVQAIIGKKILVCKVTVLSKKTTARTDVTIKPSVSPKPSSMPTQTNTPSTPKIVLPVTVEGAIFCGIGKTSVNTNLVYDSSWITSDDNTKYNSDLAAMSALLSTDVYFRTKDLDKGSQNRVLYKGEKLEDYSQTALLEKMGFTDVKYVESSKESEYTLDASDSVTMLMGYENVDNKYDAFCFVIRGCFSATDWQSIFDVGSNDYEAYKELTGEHPEWKEGSQLKGISVAAERALAIIRKYVANHDDPKRPNCAYTTGHSRGGAIANIIGANLEDDQATKSVTYAFSAPAISEDESVKDYKTIFNIYDDGDICSSLFSFSNERLYRYGIDVNKDDAKVSNIASSYKALVGAELPEGLAKEDISEYKALFSERFRGRNFLFSGKMIKEKYDTKQQADERKEECEKIIGSEGFAMGDLCSVAPVEKVSDGYEVSIKYVDQAWLVCFSKIMSYGGTYYDKAVNLFKYDKEGCKVADFLGNNLNKISNSHRIIRCYLLS